MFSHFNPEELASKIRPLSIDGVEFDAEALARELIRQGQEQMEELRSRASEISAREAERVRRAVTESGYRKAEVDIIMEYPLENESITALAGKATVEFDSDDTGYNPADGKIYRFLVDEVIPGCARRRIGVELEKIMVDVMDVREKVV